MSPRRSDQVRNLEKRSKIKHDEQALGSTILSILPPYIPLRRNTEKIIEVDKGVEVPSCCDVVSKECEAAGKFDWESLDTEVCGP